MEKKYYLGIDLGGTKIYTALANIKGKIVSELKVPTEARKNKKEIFENIYASIEHCLKSVRVSFSQIAAAGMGVPGQIDYEKGIVLNAPNIPSWKNIPVRDILEKKFKTCVHIANDAQVAALAESSYGAGKGYSNFVYVTVSTGIGSGIIIDKKLYRGHRGFAGELGHTLIHVNRKTDEVSFLESIASGTGVKEKWGFPAHVLKEKIKIREKKAIRALEHLSMFLGVGLANMSVILDPELIVLGGGLSNLGSILISPLKKELNKNIKTINPHGMKIVKAKLGKRAGVVGALLLAVQCSSKRFR